MLELLMLMVGNISSAKASKIDVSSIQNKSSLTNSPGNESKNLLDSQTAAETYINPMYKDSESSVATYSAFNDFSTLTGTGLQRFTIIKDTSDYVRKQMVN